MACGQGTGANKCATDRAGYIGSFEAAGHHGECAGHACVWRREWATRAHLCRRVLERSSAAISRYSSVATDCGAATQVRGRAPQGRARPCRQQPRQGAGHLTLRTGTSYASATPRHLRQLSPKSQRNHARGQARAYSLLNRHLAQEGRLESHLVHR